LLTLNEDINGLLESTVDSFKQVLHIPYDMAVPLLWNETTLKTEMCVMVGFTGMIKGRLLFDGYLDTFSKLGESMFGMTLEGDMLHSFVGEFANMVAGNMCTSSSLKGRSMDITPPTIVMGEMKLYGFEKALSMPIIIQNVGEMNIILLLQEEKVA
jgi:chemotaxis protein CheX